MSPILRFRLALFSWPVLWIAAISVVGINLWTIVLFFAGIVGSGRYAMSIRCPQCSKPIGQTVDGWNRNAFAPSRCTKCSYDLSQKTP